MINYYAQVAFPEPDESEDIISLRGPKEDICPATLDVNW